MLPNPALPVLWELPLAAVIASAVLVCRGLPTAPSPAYLICSARTLFALTKSVHPRLTVSARISAFNITGTLQAAASPCDALGPHYLTPRNPTPLIVSIKCPWSLSNIANHHNASHGLVKRPDSFALWLNNAPSAFFFAGVLRVRAHGVRLGCRQLLTTFYIVYSAPHFLVYLDQAPFSHTAGSKAKPSKVFTVFHLYDFLLDVVIRPDGEATLSMVPEQRADKNLYLYYATNINGLLSALRC